MRVQEATAALSGGNVVAVSPAKTSTSSSATGQARSPQSAPELRSKPQLN